METVRVQVIAGHYMACDRVTLHRGDDLADALSEAHRWIVAHPGVIRAEVTIASRAGVRSL